MSAALSVDKLTFLANVRRSGLIGDAELARLGEQLPRSARARPIARAMVEMGVLTRFQAERLLVGRTAGFLLGPYRILDQLGKGGMGRVYKAEHTGLGRLVALKVLAPELVKTERALELFRRELQAAGQINHPNVVTALDADEMSGRIFLVLEYVDGPNLDQLVRQQGALSVSLACDYVRQAALALQAAHTVGMVHRDIKPANLLVQRRGLDRDSPGLIKVTDFGLARLCETEGTPTHGTLLLKPNTVMGTPDYLSPEQSRDVHNVDIRTDLYSLGCTFYFLLTSSVPFPGGDAMSKLIRHSTQAATPLAERRFDLPPEVIAIVERLMAKQPDERFQTPAELVQALEPFAVGGPIPWAPPVRPSLDEAAPAESESGELEALTSTQPVTRMGTDDEMSVAVPRECVEAVFAERDRLRWQTRFWITVAILAANAVAWWALLRWYG